MGRRAIERILTALGCKVEAISVGRTLHLKCECPDNVSDETIRRIVRENLPPLRVANIVIRRGEQERTYVESI